MLTKRLADARAAAVVVSRLASALVSVNRLAAEQPAAGRASATSISADVPLPGSRQARA